MSLIKNTECDLSLLERCHDVGLNFFQREQFSNYQDYFAHFLTGITSFFTSGGWGLAIGTGRWLNSNPNRVGDAATAVADVAAATVEEEGDMMKSVDAVTTIKV